MSTLIKSTHKKSLSSLISSNRRSSLKKLSNNVLRTLRNNSVPSKIQLKTWNSQCKCESVTQNRDSPKPIPKKGIPKQIIPIYSVYPKGKFNDQFKRMFSQRIYSVKYDSPKAEIKKKLKKEEQRSRKIMKSYSKGKLGKILKQCDLLRSRNEITKNKCSNGLVQQLESIRSKYNPQVNLFSKDYISDCVSEFMENNQGFLFGRNCPTFRKIYK